MPISTTCPQCQALFRLPEELAGRKVKCQKCAALFVAPSAGADTTMPGVPVMLEEEPALEEVQASSPGAAPLHGIGLPPMPLDPSSAPPRDDDAADQDRYSDSPRQAPPAPTKKSDAGERPGRSRRGEQPKAGSSKVGIVLGILGFLLLAFIVCGGATAIWYSVADKKKNANPIAKKDRFREDRKKDAPKFGDFKNPPIPQDGFNGPIQSRPPFDGFIDGKQPEPPPPEPGAISVIFGADGTYRNDNVLKLDDPLNKYGRRHKLYVIRMEAGYTYQIDMSSNPLQLDAWVVLRDDKGEFIAENDDIQQGVQRDSRLIYTARESGIFHLEATFCPVPDNANPAGPYTLTVRHVK